MYYSAPTESIFRGALSRTSPSLSRRVDVSKGPSEYLTGLDAANYPSSFIHNMPPLLNQCAKKYTEKGLKRLYNIHNNFLSRVLALANIVDGRRDSFQPFLRPYKSGNETFTQDAFLNKLWNAFIKFRGELVRGTSIVPDLESEDLRELDCCFHPGRRDYERVQVSGKQ